MRRRIFPLSLLIVMILGLSACSSTPAAPTQPVVTDAPAAVDTATAIPTETQAPTATAQPTPEAEEATEAPQDTPTAQPLEETPTAEPPAEPAAHPMSDLPLPPGAEIDNALAVSQPGKGSFRIPAPGSLEEMLDFYAAELPALGWQMRSTGANYTGGQSQSWQRGEYFLDLDFGYEQGEPRLVGDYHSVASDLVAMLPAEFPLPEASEPVFTGENAWRFYTSQPFEQVLEFYDEQMLTVGWQKIPAGAVKPGEGGIATPVEATFPFGVTPMPTPTPDARQPERSSWIMTETEQVDLEIRPQQGGAEIIVAITPHQTQAAAWLYELPVYPGAVLKIVDQDMLGYETPENIEILREFFKAEMPPLGWTLEGEPYAINLKLQTWVKDGQTLRITMSYSTKTVTMVYFANGN